MNMKYMVEWQMINSDEWADNEHEDFGEAEKDFQFAAGNDEVETVALSVCCECGEVELIKKSKKESDE